MTSSKFAEDRSNAIHRISSTFPPRSRRRARTFNGAFATEPLIVRRYHLDTKYTRNARKTIPSHARRWPGRNPMADRRLLSGESSAAAAAAGNKSHLIKRCSPASGERGHRRKFTTLRNLIYYFLRNTCANIHDCFFRAAVRESGRQPRFMLSNVCPLGTILVGNSAF